MVSQISTPNTETAPLPAPFCRILEARHHDPFEVLGKHREGNQDVVRAFLPYCDEVRIEENGESLTRIENTDLFEWRGAADSLPDRYQFAWTDRDGIEWVTYDPYCFPPQLGDLDLHWFGEGRHLHAYRFLGAHLCEVEGVAGTRFAVWAPGAERVSVVGDWNHWDGRRHPMRSRGGSGIWELFIPGVSAHELYKFEIRNRERGTVHL
jgi:1,4-alpha-glucan branching enzyme